MTNKVVLISNTAWSIYNFRRGLIAELLRYGYSVTAIAPPDEYSARITQTGAQYIPLEMDNRGTDPLRDLRLCVSLVGILRNERPACVLTFTVKPNVFGAFAARALGIPIVINISGLGTVFIKRSWVTAVVRMLYRVALRFASRVFFQNQDDLEYFVGERLVDPSKAWLVPGSGVDTKMYSPAPESATPQNTFRFLLLGRILWDKGVGEFVEAAARMRRRHSDFEIVLMGFIGVENVTAVPMSQIEEWDRKGIVKYVSASVDVRPEIAKADCVVLPSYREGTPKALLEAASMGKPIITTDVPGCRQVVDDGVTGFLVRVRDAADLADKMERMLSLSEAERRAMGLRGREKMIREFDERIVIERYLQAIQEAAARG